MPDFVQPAPAPAPPRGVGRFTLGRPRVAVPPAPVVEVVAPAPVSEPVKPPAPRPTGRPQGRVSLRDMRPAAPEVVAPVPVVEVAPAPIPEPEPVVDVQTEPLVDLTRDYYVRALRSDGSRWFPPQPLQYRPGLPARRIIPARDYGPEPHGPPCPSALHPDTPCDSWIPF